MSKVLVTGASGFEGHYVVHDLLEHGYEVRAMVRSPERAASLEGLDVEIVYADLADHESLRKAVRGVDHVVHPAYSAQGRDAGDPLQEFMINEGGSLVLLEEARQQGVEKFVFTSSGASVGYRSPTKWFPTYPITETSPCFPTDIYGAGKAGVEKWCLAYYHEYGVQTVTLRTMWVYGTYRIDRPELIALGSATGCPADMEMIDFIRGHDFLGTFYNYTERALAGEAITVPGGSFQMTHVRDLATANRLAIESSEGGEVYSVNDDLMSWKSFIERVLELTGSDSALSFEPTPENEVFISNERIKQKLGIEFAGLAGIDACIQGCIRELTKQETEK
jgi:nucleoside-diphosphate-sugar epimerase